MTEHTEPNEATAPLSSFADLRVVELGLWTAAPSASALLADLGAQVIKIEPKKGDPSRGYGANANEEVLPRSECSAIASPGLPEPSADFR